MGTLFRYWWQLPAPLSEVLKQHKDASCRADTAEKCKVVLAA